MIPSVHPRGTRVGGLLRYLFGPGKREEHVSPRLIAAWNGAGTLADLEPPTNGTGRRDLQRLTELLEQPVRSGWNAPQKTVWHCSIRNHPTDRLLTDAQWAHIAGEVMAAVGLAPHGDTAAVRWVAIRHNDDHIHLVATLVRQDLRTAWAWKDKLNAQRACRDLEERYGLYRVGPPGAGSRTWPSPAELNKAARLKQTDRRGRTETARYRLRRIVSEMATIATGEREFFTRLANAGVEVRLRYSSQHREQVTGYAVTLAGSTTATGDPVWYGGGRLARDLSFPRLRNRWADETPQPAPAGPAQLAGLSFPPVDPYRRAADTVRAATAAMRATKDPAVTSAIARAAADVLVGLAVAVERRRGGPLTDAAELFQRAAYQRKQPTAARIRHVTQLRSMGRLIALMNAVGDDQAADMLRLAYSLAELAEHVAGFCQAQQRLHQAAVARSAAALLRTYTWQPEDGRTRSTPVTVEPQQIPILSDTVRRRR